MLFSDSFKILVSILAILLAMTLTACGAKSSNKKTTQESSTTITSTTITYSEKEFAEHVKEVSESEKSLEESGFLFVVKKETSQTQLSLDKKHFAKHIKTLEDVKKDILGDKLGLYEGLAQSYLEKFSRPFVLKQEGSGKTRPMEMKAEFVQQIQAKIELSQNIIKEMNQAHDSEEDLCEALLSLQITF